MRHGFPEIHELGKRSSQSISSKPPSELSTAGKRGEMKEISSLIAVGWVEALAPSLGAN